MGIMIPPRPDVDPKDSITDVIHKMADRLKSLEEKLNGFNDEANDGLSKREREKAVESFKTSDVVKELLDSPPVKIPFFLAVTDPTVINKIVEFLKRIAASKNRSNADSKSAQEILELIGAEDPKPVGSSRIEIPKQSEPAVLNGWNDWRYRSSGVGGQESFDSSLKDELANLSKKLSMSEDEFINGYTHQGRSIALWKLALEEARDDNPSDGESNADWWTINEVLVDGIAHAKRDWMKLNGSDECRCHKGSDRTFFATTKVDKAGVPRCNICGKKAYSHPVQGIPNSEDDYGLSTPTTFGKILAEKQEQNDAPYMDKNFNVVVPKAVKDMKSTFATYAKVELELVFMYVF